MYFLFFPFYCESITFNKANGKRTSNKEIHKQLLVGTVKRNEQHLTWHETFCEKFKLKKKTTTTTTTFICNGWSGSWQEWKSEWVREWNYVDMLTSFVYLLLLLVVAGCCCCNFISSHSTYTLHEWKSFSPPPYSMAKCSSLDFSWKWFNMRNSLINKQTTKLLLGKLFYHYYLLERKSKGKMSKKKCWNINMQIYFYVLCCHWNWCAECDMFMNKVLYATNNLYIYVFLCCSFYSSFRCSLNSFFLYFSREFFLFFIKYLENFPCWLLVVEIINSLCRNKV